MSWAYLAAVLASTAGTAVADARYRLVLFGDRRRRGRSLVVVACGAVTFLVWDVLAIHLGFYQRGGSPGMTGIEVASQLPVEELFFIAFLCYLTLVLHGLLRMAVRRSTRTVRPARPEEAHR